MKNKAIIFITAFNCEKYIEKCISSVSEQSFQDTLIILIDDSSNDGTYNVATKALTRLFPDRHKIIKNDKKIGKAGNAFLHLNGNDAIFCAILDGDDYLLDPTILQDYYEQYKLGYDVVWSNYQINDIRIGQIKGHSAALNPMQNPRSQGWKTSHFFSFRYQLFTVVPKYYFKDDNGTWLQSACDQAIALPILDQTRRYKFINKVSYFYRTDNPNNHHNKNNLGTKALQISSQQQRQNSKIVYSKTPLPLAFRLHNARIPKPAKLSVDQALLKAQSHMEEAQKLYKAILQSEPNNLQAQKGLASLTECIQPADTHGPPQEALDQLVTYYNRGQLEQVIDLALAIIEEYPEAVLVWNILGVANKRLDKTQQALNSFKKVTELNPNYADGLNNFGVCLKDLGNLDEAIGAFQTAISVKPDHADAYYNLGNSLKTQANLKEATNAYKQVVLIKPNYAEAYNMLGSALLAQSRLNEAIEAYEQVVSLKPNSADAYNNLGVALKKQGKLKEAIVSYNKSLSLNPDYAGTYNNMGNALRDQGKLDEAIASLNKALSLKPDYAEAYNNMGTTLQEQGKLDEAIASYNKALSLKPEYAEAYNNMGRLRWLQGKFKVAFELLEYRWLAKNQTIGEVLKTTKPEWQGEKERLFLWKEQGIGDEIMFSSLLIEAEQHATSLIVECDRRLLTIFTRSCPSKVKFIDDRKKVNEKDYDSHVAVGSLLKHFRNNMGDFEKSAAGWLKADQARTNKYRSSLLSKTSSKLIGLSWFTKAKKVNSHFRNIEVEQLSDHLHGLSFDFVSLQYGLSKEELAEINSKLRINILSIDELDLFNDIDGLASLIAACDIVISVDNVNVHLAGALGVDTRVMLPKVSDERWGMTSEQSYLYDSVKLYRQTKKEDWSAQLKVLKKEL